MPGGGIRSGSGLAEQLLLLAVGPRASYRTRGDVRLLVAAGATADEVLADGRTTGHETTEQGLRRRAERALQVATAHLVAAGSVAPHTHRVLRLFPRHGLVVTDPAARDGVEQRMMAALTPLPPGAPPVPGPASPPQPPAALTPADAALAVLASVSGIARQHVTLRSDAERRAYRDHVNGLAAVTGPDVAAVVLALRTAYRRSGSDDGVVLFVPVDDTDGYGDSGGDGDASAGGDGGDGGGGD